MFDMHFHKCYTKDALHNVDSVGVLLCENDPGINSMSTMLMLPHVFMRQGGSEGIAPQFLTSALDRGDLSASRHANFSMGKSHQYLLDRRLGGSHF
jgi:hypothetical protein